MPRELGDRRFCRGISAPEANCVTREPHWATSEVGGDVAEAATP